MNIINLNGSWRLKYRQAGSHVEWSEIEATVPGCVELDMMKNNLLPDLSVGNNVYAALELENYEWIYQKSFTLSDIYIDGRTELVFDGIDCIAEIKLNGHTVGHADNMLIGYRFNVSGQLLKAGENIIEVHILPTVSEGRKYEPSVIEFAQPTNWESLRIRKAGHMFGWDITPRIVSAGLWRGVKLEHHPTARIRGAYWGTKTVDVENQKAEVLFVWDVESFCTPIYDMTLDVKIAKDSSEIYSEQINLCSHHGKKLLELNNVEFWWPRGYGEAVLYDATLTLKAADGSIISERTEKIGIRTIKLRMTDVTSDAMDGDFSFIVNGQRIFVKGTNWVPLDSLHSRDVEHYKRTLDMAVDLNCNMLRCWGGNVYEDHAFFDYCDAAGIMIWQDFALACACHPQDLEFLSRMDEEASFIVKKLRNHSSMALWSGNNEIDIAYQGWGGIDLDPNQIDMISRQILAKAVQRLDPMCNYLPSSPYCSPELVRQGNKINIRPEDHLWGPRDDFKGPFYMSSNAHFVSEIGYHGCPDVKSICQMMGTDNPWPWQNNELWITKAPRPMPLNTTCNCRIQLMANQIMVLFDQAPDNLEDFVLASQISQAEAVKFFIEKWRSEKNIRSGILWWNLRDCWPIISDAIVDYYYRKKLAYNYVKASQTDICAIVTEAESGNHKLVLVNDTPQAVSGSVELFSYDRDKSLLMTDFSIAPNGMVVAGTIPLATAAELWLSRVQLGESEKQLVNHYIARTGQLKLDQYKIWLKFIKKERSND